MLSENGIIRLFVAVKISQEIKDEVVRLQQLLKKESVCDGRFTKPQDMHITLKFIGDVATDQLEVIQHALNTIEIPRMLMQLDCLDVFMFRRKVKIIFLRVSSPELVKLASRIEQCLLPWVPAEKRKFIPHITLMRVKQVTDEKKLALFMRDAPIKQLSCTASSFVLKKSLLTLEGPEHTNIACFSLKKE